MKCCDCGWKLTSLFAKSVSVPRSVSAPSETPQKCPGARPYPGPYLPKLDGRLAALFYPQADTTISARHVHCRIGPLSIQEPKRKGVSKQLLWEGTPSAIPIAVTATPSSVTVTSPGVRLQKRSMPPDPRQGKKLFIDLRAPVPIVSPTTGEVRQAQVFVAVLGASNYTFAEATWSRSLPDWLQSHVRAFEFGAGHRYC